MICSILKKAVTSGPLREVSGVIFIAIACGAFFFSSSPSFDFFSNWIWISRRLGVGKATKQTPNDVQVLSQVAIPIHIKLHMDWSGQSRGSALAEFAYEGDAAAVVKTLNGVRHMGRTIGVRFDTMPTVVGYI
jgi:RNA recognition motif-containing protein